VIDPLVPADDLKIADHPHPADDLKIADHPHPADDLKIADHHVRLVQMSVTQLAAGVAIALAQLEMSQKVAL
jgi:hypothetical protein